MCLYFIDCTFFKLEEVHRDSQADCPQNPHLTLVSDCPSLATWLPYDKHRSVFSACKKMFVNNLKLKKDEYILFRFKDICPHKAFLILAQLNRGEITTIDQVYRVIYLSS
jgi:hypothetical protein